MGHSRYLVIPIVPADSGFGEWQRSLHTSRARTVEEAVKNLTEGIVDEAIELPDPALEEQGADISNLIQEEPTRIFAYDDGYGGYNYFGLEDLRPNA